MIEHGDASSRKARLGSGVQDPVQTYDLAKSSLLRYLFKSKTVVCCGGLLQLILSCAAQPVHPLEPCPTVSAATRSARPVLAQLPPAARVNVDTRYWWSPVHRGGWKASQAQQARHVGQSKEAPKATKKA